MIPRMSLAAAGILCAMALPAASAEYEMKISTMFPSTHFIQTMALEPWAKSIEERSGGRVKFTFFPAGSALGDATKQFDQVRAGVVDVAVGIPAIPRGRHPRTVLMELPFTVASSEAGTKALMDIYQDYLLEDFPGTRVLSLTLTEPSAIHTKAPIENLEGLKGMRVRAPTPSVTAILEAVGATPVGMPPTQIYESVERGVVDGNVMPWGPVGAFKIWEVLHNHLNARMDTVTMYTLINQQRYDSLPDDIKALFDEAPAYFTENWGQWWYDTDQKAIEAAKGNGNTIVEVDPATREQWREEMKPVIDAYLAEQEKTLPNAREIYGAMVEAVGKYEKQ